MPKRFVVVVLSAVTFIALSWCGTPAKVCGECTSGTQCVAGQCVPTAAGGGTGGGSDADAAIDAGLDDAGSDDAGPDDAGLDDAGLDDAGLDDAGIDDAGIDDAGTIDGGSVQRIRVMAANLTAGNNQNYNVPPGDVTPGPGPRIMLGAHPDVVMVQEFRVGADNDAGILAFAESILGPGASVCREIIEGAGDIPNGIMSRYPILECGEWQDSRLTNRDYAYARIDIPGPIDLWAISVHLHTTFGSRVIEGTELRDNVLNNIPGGDYVVLGGDFNTDTSDPLAEPIFTVLDDVFVVQPQPSDQFGNSGTNTNRLLVLADGGLDPMRNKPYDWVVGNADFTALEVPVVLTDGTTTYTLPHGFIIDTRVFDAGTIGLIAPALLGDSAAVNMQHMGVIRDFDVPVP